LRAVHSDADVEAWVVTSYPLSPAFGLQIDEIRRECGRTAGEYQDARWVDTVSRFEEARENGAGSFREINAVLKKLGKMGISSASYQKLRSRIESFDMSMDGIDAEELEQSIRALLDCENPVVEAKTLLAMEHPRVEWVIAALTVIDVIESETQSRSMPKTG
jgi:hypothetical protein